MNQGTFAGRLGRDADLRQGDTPAKSVANFSVAVDVGWGDKKRTLWIACAVWGERAEKLAQYLTKGTSVTVSGDVDLRQYEKRDKTAGAELTLNVQRLTLQGGGQGGSQGSKESRDGEGTSQPSSSRQETKTPAVKDGGEFDDDIPF
jgi:single-strand DNA-binding protein